MSVETNVCRLLHRGTKCTEKLQNNGSLGQRQEVSDTYQLESEAQKVGLCVRWKGKERGGARNKTMERRESRQHINNSCSCARLSVIVCVVTVVIVIVMMMVVMVVIVVVAGRLVKCALLVIDATFCVKRNTNDG